MTADPREARCPYPGLEAFTADNRQYFIGRERDTQLLISNLYASPLTIVYGSSGVGKTSVILAGVVPEVEREGDAIIVVHRTWQDAARARSLSGRLAEAVAAHLGEAPLPAEGTLDAVAERLAARARRHIFLVFDQFEEYFLHNEPSDAADALDGEMARLINRREIGVHVMIVMREDSLATLDRFGSRIPALLGNLYRLEHLTRPEALRAIEEPLATLRSEAGPHDVPVDIDQGLATAILDDVAALDRSSTVGGASDTARVELPFLQVVLERLWITECRARSRILRRDTFRDAGRARGIVRQRIEEALNSLDAGERLIVASVLRHLVTPSGAKIALTMTDLRGYAGVDEADVQRVMERLVGSEARLVRRVAHPSGDRALTKYEIYHDALGAPLLEWRVEVDRRRDEVAHRSKRRVRDSIAALVLFAVVAVWVAVFLQRGKSRLEARELATTASGQLETDNGRALLLALAAIDRNGSEESGETVLRRALFEPGERLRDSIPATIVKLVAAPRGRFVAGVDQHQRPYLWLADSLRRVPLPAGFDSVSSVAFDSAGRHLLLVSPTRVGLVDLSSNAVSVVDTPAAEAHATEGFVLGTGERVLVGYRNGSVSEWTRSGAMWNRTATSPAGYSLVGWVANQRWIAYARTAAEGGAFRGTETAVIDLDKRPWTLYRFFPRGASAPAFASPNHLAVVRGKTVEVLSLTSPDARTVELSCEISDVAIAGHEASGACTGGGFVSFTLPDPGSQTRLGTEPPLVNRPGGLTHLELSPDGRFALTIGSRDVAPTVWSRFARVEATRLRGHRDAVTAATFLPDSRHVITAGADSTIRLWEVVSAARRIGDGEFMGGRATAVLNDSATGVAMTGPYGAQLWNLKRGVATVESPVRGGFPVLAISPLADRLAIYTAFALVEEYPEQGRTAAKVWRVPLGTDFVSRSGANLAASSRSELVYLGRDTLLIAAGIGDNDSAKTSVLVRLVRGGDAGMAIAKFPSATQALAVDVAGEYAAVARTDGALNVVNLRANSADTLYKFEGGATAVAFGPGTRLASAGNDGAVVFTSPRRGSTPGSLWAAMVKLGAHDRAVLRLTFDRLGQLLASGDAGGTTRVWRLDQRSELCSLEGQHADYIRAIAFAPSGRTLATADERGVAIWFIDLAGSSCRFSYRLADLEAPTEALRFAPDGSALVVVGRDGIIRTYQRRVWSPRDSLIALANRRLRGRVLTDDEKRRYVDRR